jgi:hypothetical protein
MDEVIRIHSKAVKAKKDHVCDDCFKPIKEGARYRRVFWLVEGRPVVTTTHFGECEFKA